MTLSDLDRRVLRALAADGRASLRDVARTAGLPTATVAERVQALEDEGVVTGYRPVLDLAALGFDTVAVFELAVNQSMLPAVRSRLLEERRLTTVYEVAGRTDVVAFGRYESTASVDVQLRTLWGVPGVLDVSVAVAESVHRDEAPVPPVAAGDDG